MSVVLYTRRERAPSRPQHVSDGYRQKHKEERPSTLLGFGPVPRRHDDVPLVQPLMHLVPLFKKIDVSFFLKEVFLISTAVHAI